MKRYTVHDFRRQFDTDAACLEFLKNARWPKGITCPTEKRVTLHHRLSKRPAYSCQECGHHVYPLAGTIFHKSPTPLRSWFHAMFLMAQTRCGISGKQLQRELGVTYKTAWRMFKQIRILMDEDGSPLSGIVEVDETYVGGRKRGGKVGRATQKAVVVGLSQRGGRIIARTAKDTKAESLMPTIKQYVMPESTVFTDEWVGYKYVGNEGYTHRRTHHAAKVYVMGDVHTNTVEGFWSLVKRGIGGVHHVVGSAYLQSYMNAYSFRWNHRNDSQPMFQTLLSRVPAVSSVSWAPASGPTFSGGPQTLPSSAGGQEP